MSDVIYDGQAHNHVPTIPGLVDGYHITTEPTRYVLRCKTCKAAWTLPLKPPHPGNVLKLLDHTAGCVKKANARNRDALNRFFGG